MTWDVSRPLAAWVMVLATFAPAYAHHSFAAAFDGAKPITLEGHLVEVKYENPHSWFYLDVTDEAGTSVRWAMEASTPTSMVRSGIKREFFKTGDKVTVKGFRARDPNANMGALREITLSDGRSFIVGPSDTTRFGLSGAKSR